MGLELCHLLIIFLLITQVVYHRSGVCHLLILFLLIPKVVYHGTRIVSFTDHIPLDSAGIDHRSGSVSVTDHIVFDFSGSLSGLRLCYLLVVFLLIPNGSGIVFTGHIPLDS